MSPSLEPSSSPRRDLAFYVLLTFALSWAIEIPLARSTQEQIQAPIPFWLHYLAPSGPLCAAGVVTLATSGWGGLIHLLSGLARWRVLPVSAVVAVLAPLVVFAARVPATWATRGDRPHLAALGQPDYLPAIGILPTWLLWTVTFGVGEEVGWRGFALPRLQAGPHSLLRLIGPGRVLGRLAPAGHLLPRHLHSNGSARPPDADHRRRRRLDGLYVDLERQRRQPAVAGPVPWPVRHPLLLAGGHRGARDGRDGADGLLGGARLQAVWPAGARAGEQGQRGIGLPDPWHEGVEP